VQCTAYGVMPSRCGSRAVKKMWPLGKCMVGSTATCAISRPRQQVVQHARAHPRETISSSSGTGDRGRTLSELPWNAVNMHALGRSGSFAEGLKIGVGQGACMGRVGGSLGRTAPQARRRRCAVALKTDSHGRGKGIVERRSPYVRVLWGVWAGQKVGSSVLDDDVEVALVVHTAVSIVLDRRPPPASAPDPLSARVHQLASRGTTV